MNDGGIVAVRAVCTVLTVRPVFARFSVRTVCAVFHQLSGGSPCRGGNGDGRFFGNGGGACGVTCVFAIWDGSAPAAHVSRQFAGCKGVCYYSGGRFRGGGEALIERDDCLIIAICAVLTVCAILAICPVFARFSVCTLCASVDLAPVDAKSHDNRGGNVHAEYSVEGICVAQRYAIGYGDCDGDFFAFQRRADGNGHTFWSTRHACNGRRDGGFARVCRDVAREHLFTCYRSVCRRRESNACGSQHHAGVFVLLVNVQTVEIKGGRP